MLTKVIRLAVMAAVVLAVCVPAFAQKRPGVTSTTANKFLISAEAGGVNQVEGPVTVARMGGTSGLLLKGDQIEIGDRITTGADGRAEILLNPGSYLRLGGHSSFEFKTTSLDDLQIKLSSGSAMFEVYAANEFTVSIFTPKGEATLVETGVYRVDVFAEGSGIISVTKGKALVGATQVKKGRTASIGAGVVAVAKFDTDKRDELAEWSKVRGKDLAKMTSSLNKQSQSVRDALMSSFYGGRWNLRGSFGVWVFDPFWGRYCFLPFGYGWSSPYGHGYGSGIWGYSLPWRVVYQTPPSITPGPVGGTSSSKNPKREPRIDPDGDSKRGSEKGFEPPPYMKMGGKRETPNVYSDPFGSSTERRSDPVFSPPSRQSAPVSAPVYSPPPMPSEKSIPLPDKKPIDN